MITRTLVWIPVIVLVNAILFIFDRPAHADEIETFPDVLLPSELPFTSPMEDDPFSPRLGIRKGRGFQIVKSDSPVCYKVTVVELTLNNNA